MTSHKRPPLRRFFVLLIIAGMGIAAIAFAIVNVIPTSAITRSAMMETSARVEMYFQRHKRLPPDLSVLPLRENHVNRTTDAWGRTIGYVVDADDLYTLSSLGEDGTAGGTGDDADLVQRYRIEHGNVRPVQ